MTGNKECCIISNQLPAYQIIGASTDYDMSAIYTVVLIYYLLIITMFHLVGLILA